jgi:hypothetical protein
MNFKGWILGVAAISALQAADLKQVSLDAWDQYVRSADAAMQDRLHEGSHFLWADEAPSRRAQLRAGEILVTGVGEHNPQKVPAGLVHHWMGAAFLPDTTMSDVLRVVRDYQHYKNYYNPTVVESKAISQTPDTDRFSTLLMNKALFLTMALESECESSYVQAGPHTWYSIATTLRVREIEDYGQASERRLPLDQGSGYIWRLHSIARYEESDGGVYVEIEGMALSREVPAAMRWVVEPIVRRVSKGSLATSLRQTQEAVSSAGRLSARQSAPSQVALPGPALGFAPSPAHH